jgi:hypothetical protein
VIAVALALDGVVNGSVTAGNCTDLKGVGVDCGMLIVRVFVDTGLCAPFDPRP